MVLTELGKKISDALHKLNKKVIANEAVEECVKEICRGLVAADVRVEDVRICFLIYSIISNDESIAKLSSPLLPGDLSLGNPEKYQGTSFRS